MFFEGRFRQAAGSFSSVASRFPVANGSLPLAARSLPHALICLLLGCRPELPDLWACKEDPVVIEKHKEGHTAHASYEEATEMVFEILNLYSRVYEELLFFLRQNSGSRCYG